MKITFYFFNLLFLPIILGAQEVKESLPTGNFVARQVSHLAIFPGCEKEGVENKSGLTRCFAQKLNERLGDELNLFGDEFRKEGFSAAYAKIRFVVNTEGKIVNVKHLKDPITIEANEKLGTAAEFALIDISKTIAYIIPAKTNDTINVNLQFDLPVFWKSGDSKLGKMKWKEIVVATMYGGEEKFELRQSKDQQSFSVYLLEGTTGKFLQKFNDLIELETSERMGGIFQKNKEKRLMVDKKIDSNYHIRIYYSQDDPTKYNVYSVSNEKETLREVNTMQDMVSSELYLKDILR
jgi:hypothetical protein